VHAVQDDDDPPVSVVSLEKSKQAAQKFPVLKVKAPPSVSQTAFAFAGLPLCPDEQESSVAAWRTEMVQPPSPLSQSGPALSVPTGSVQALDEKVQMLPPLMTAASFLPSDDEAIEIQLLPVPVDVSSVQVTPESVDVQMLPPVVAGGFEEGGAATAASFVPSDDEAIDLQFLTDPVDVFSVQVTPESFDVQMLPKLAGHPDETTAASFVPSDDIVIDFQYLTLGCIVFVLSVQVAPESVDIQMLPPRVSAAASFVPSDDIAIDSQ